MGKIIEKGSKYIYLIAIIELMLLFSCIFPFFKPLSNYEYTGLDFVASKGKYVENFMNGNRSGYYIDESMVEEGDDLFDYRIEIPGTNLNRGSYEVKISYSTGSDTNTYRTGSWSEYYQTEIGRQYVELDSKKNECVFSMESNVDVEGYTVGVNFNGEEYVFVDKISVTETSAFKVRNLVTTIFVILLFNSLWITYKRKTEMFKKNNVMVMIILGCSVVFASLPIFTPYLFSGHDLYFHLNRIEGMKNAILAGNIPVKMHYSTLGGAGYPTSIFYGDLLLYIPAILRVLGWSVQSAYQTYVFAINLLTCVIIYKVLMGIFKDQWIAVFGSCMYMLVPYRLECIYVRAAVGEYTAACFYPLIIYGLYYMYTKEEEKKYDWLYLAFGFSGLILSHTISTFLAFCVTLLFCIVNIKNTLNKEIILKICKAVAVTVGLCAGFLIPFIDYMSLPIAVNTSTLHGEFEARTATLGQLLSVFPSGGKGLLVQFQAETGVGVQEMTYGLGGVFILVPILYAMYYFHTQYHRGKLEKLGEMTLLLGGICLFMITPYFPWNEIEGLGEVVRYMMYGVQYPWRLLSMISILWVVALTVAVNGMREQGKESLYYSVVTAVCILAFISASYIMTTHMERADRHYFVHENDVNSYYVGYEEYILEGGTRGYEGILYEEECIQIADFGREKDEYFVECENLTGEMQYVQIPIMNYDNYRAKDLSSGNELKMKNGEQCRIKVEVPANYRGTIVIEYVIPWYWHISEMISVCTVLGVVLVLQKKKMLIYKK